MSGGVPARAGDQLAALGLAAAVALPVLRVAAGGPEALYLTPVLLLLAACLAGVPRRGGSLPPAAALYVLCTMLLSIWLVTSGLWTVSPGQYRRDLVLIVGLLAIITPMAFCMSEHAARRTLTFLVGSGCLTAVWLVAQYIGAGTMSGYSLPIGSAYLPVAQLLGAAAVGGACVIVSWRPQNSRWWVGGTFICFAGVGLSMARGALLSAIGTVLIACLVQLILLFIREFRGSLAHAAPRSTWRRFRALLLPPFVAVCTLVLALQVDRTAARLRRLFSGRELESGGRGWIWENAWASLAESPLFGYGLGSSGVMSGQADGNYAHNLLLQVWLDAGVVALFLLVVLLAIPFLMALLKLRVDRVPIDAAMPFLAVYLFMILEFSKSGNFYASRGFFIFGLLAVLMLGLRGSRPEPAALYEAGNTRSVHHV